MKTNFLKKINLGDIISFFIFRIVPLIIILIIVLIFGINVFHQQAQWYPNYEKVSLTDIISKESLSGEDYELILTQTGLYKDAVDALKSNGKTEDILKFQENFFNQFNVYTEIFAPFTCQHIIDEPVQYAPLRNGDIIVTDTTHFSFFSIGHAAIVVDAKKGIILNAVGYDDVSETCSIEELTNRPNFTILRPNASEEECNKAVKYVMENMIDLKYSISVGLFGSKFPKHPKKTNCSHIVWCAYKSIGIDLDSNGGLFVLPNDIAESEHLKKVQVFGKEPN